MNTDRIEKSIVLRAPLATVWRAISDHREFGAWFCAELEGPFVAGRQVHGRITREGYTHLTFELWVERVEPPHTLVFRWHPAAIEPGADYSQEPTTEVAFTLEEVEGGTRVTVVESGYDRLPPERRVTALRMNDEGWTIQMAAVGAYVDAKA